jgi:low affinity Fe/Cu permease
MRTWMRGLIEKTLAVFGSPWVALGTMLSVAVWVGSGAILPIPHTWRFVASLCYSLVILLIACALRYKQQQEMRAIERKLNEVIHAVKYLAPPQEEQGSDATTITTTDTLIQLRVPDRAKTLQHTRNSGIPPYSLN